jgi:hypothetical protein
VQIRPGSVYELPRFPAAARQGSDPNNSAFRMAGRFHVARDVTVGTDSVTKPTGWAVGLRPQYRPRTSYARSA